MQSTYDRCGHVVQWPRVHFRTNMANKIITYQQMTWHNRGPKMLAKFYPFSDKSESKQFTMKSTFLISLKISMSGSTDQCAHMATTCRSVGAVTPSIDTSSPVCHSPCHPHLSPALKTRNQLIFPHLCCYLFPAHLRQPLDSAGI